MRKIELRQSDADVKDLRKIYTVSSVVAWLTDQNMRPGQLGVAHATHQFERRKHFSNLSTNSHRSGRRTSIPRAGA
ncbi:MAG: hypothetical protein WB762_12760 [Candidatus Sulfotelmatobacter sp.]